MNIFIGIETYKNNKQIQNKAVVSCLKGFLVEKIYTVSNLLSDDIKILSKLDPVVDRIFNSLNPSIIIASYNCYVNKYKKQREISSRSEL